MNTPKITKFFLLATTILSPVVLFFALRLRADLVRSDMTIPEALSQGIAIDLMLAIDPDGAAERGYLALLAARLRLDPDLVAHIHANAVGAPVKAAAWAIAK